MATSVWDEALCEGSPDNSHEFASQTRALRAARPKRHDPEPIRIDHTSLSAFLNAMRRQARLASVVGKLPQLRAIAAELFLGATEICIENDPDMGMHFVVVNVESSGDLKEIANRRAEWYNLSGVLLKQECELVRLIVTVRE